MSSVNEISFNSLIENYQIDNKYLKLACYNYRKGKSNSWKNQKDPNDNRKVLIDIDTIPTRTRTKYNIPTSAELTEQQNSIQTDKELNHINRTLQFAINQDYINYLDIYKQECSTVNQARDKAIQHSVYTSIIQLLGENRAVRNQLKKVFKIYSTLNFKGKLTTKDSLSRKINSARKNVKNTVLHGNINNQNRAVVNEFHKSMILLYATQPNIYPSTVITHMVNFEAEKYDQKTISNSAVKTMLAKQAIKSLIEEKRYGTASFENNVLPYLPRTKEQFAGDLWVMDGTPVQFYCWNGETGNKKKFIRLNLFVVIDAFSGKIVGYDVSLSEDRFNVLNALKMAFSIEGHLPKQILHDNFSANKTEEVRKIKEDLELMGVLFRAAKVGNAKDKTHVERFFGTFQSTVMRLYDDYLGEGITSKRKNGRPSQKFVQKAMKQTTVTSEQLKYRISEQIKTYNNLSISNKSTPISRYEISPKPNVKTLNNEQIPFLFWYRKTITVRRSMVEITIQKQKYFYEIYENYLKAELNNTKVDVFYDEKDLDKIMLFTCDTDQSICECKRIVGPRASEVGESDTATLKVLKHDAKNKSYKSYIQKESNRIINDGLELIGEDQFTPTDPLTTDKYASNNKETDELQEYYLTENQIDTSEMNVLANQLPRKTHYTEKYLSEDDLMTFDIPTPKECKIYKPKSPND